MADNEHSESDKTEVYGDGDPNKTRAYSGDDRTRAYGETGARGSAGTPPESAGETILGVTIGDSISLGKNSYRVQSLISGPEATAEAVVFKIQDDSGQNLALKLYHEFSNPRDEPNGEALRRISDIKNPDILPLFSHGTGAEKYQGRFCYEISRFAEGGDLLSVTPENFRAVYTPDFIRNVVIPEILNGIRALHENRIYHCDIKPRNIFYLDANRQDLVIGDYGSAKTFEESSEKTLAHTFLSKGTSFYLAPEQARGVISEKNDYYSLGMVLLHLLYPDHVNQETLRRIIERQFAKKPILDFDPAFGDLNELIAGLTLQDLGSRWGRRETEEWLSGNKPGVRYAAVEPIKLGKREIASEDQLLAYINEEESDWHENFIEDAHGADLLLGWVSRQRDLNSKKKLERDMQFCRDAGPGYVRETLHRFFRPEGTLLLEGEIFDFFGQEAPEELTTRFFALLDQAWKKRGLDWAELQLFRLELPLRILSRQERGKAAKRARLLLDRIDAVLEVPPAKGKKDFPARWFQRKDRDLFLHLFYEFNPERRFRDEKNKDIRELEEVALFFARDPNRYENEHLALERRVALTRAGGPELVHADMDQFMFSVLRAHVRSEIRHLSISGDRDGTQANLTAYKIESLDDFFLKNDIEPPRLKGAPPAEKITYNLPDEPPERFFKNFWEMFLKKENLTEASISKRARENYQKAALPALISLRKERAVRRGILRAERLKKRVRNSILAPLAFLPLVGFIFIILAEAYWNLEARSFIKNFYIISSGTPALQSAAPSERVGAYFSWLLILVLSSLPFLVLYIFLYPGGDKLPAKERTAKAFQTLIKTGEKFLTAPFFLFIFVYLIFSGAFTTLPPLFHLRLNFFVAFLCLLVLLAYFTLLIYREPDEKSIIPRRMFEDPSSRGIELGAATALAGIILFLALRPHTLDVSALNQSFASNKNAVYSIDFSPDGRLLTYGMKNKKIVVHDLKSNKKLHEFERHGADILNVKFTPAGNGIFSASDDQLVFYHSLADNRFMSGKKHRSSAWSLAADPRSLQAASGGRDGRIYVWRVYRKRMYGTLVRTKMNDVWALAFSRDGSRLAAGGSSRKISLWKIKRASKSNRIYRIHNKISLPERTADVFSLSFARDKRLIFLGTGDGKLILYDIKKKADVYVKKEHREAIWSLAVSPDGSRVITGGRDGTLRLWKAGDGTLLKTFREHAPNIWTAAFHPSGRYIAGADGNGKILIRDLKKELEK